MNVVCLFGSPRKEGNSAVIAEHFLRCAEVSGAAIERIHLNDLAYRGCQACYACKQDHAACVLCDDLTPVLASVFAADIVVLASPVYYGDVSAQLKAFIDRTFSFLVPGYIAQVRPSRLPAPKKLVFVLTQGHRDATMFADILPRYQELFAWTGFAETYPLRAVDVYHEGDIDGREELLGRAEELARQLLG